MSADSKKAVVVAFLINLAIAIIKLFAAVLSGSKAMLAEGFHSVADSFNQLFLLLGMRLAGREADSKHQFGYGKERYFWSFVVALGIFLVGGVVALYEGIEKIAEALHGVQHQHEDLSLFGLTFHPVYLSLGILGISAFLETMSWLVAMKEFRKSLNGRTAWQAINESRDSTLVTVLFEDTAALFGLIIAFVFILLAFLTNNVIWDGIGSVVVGVLLVACAGSLARISKTLLIGVGLLPADEVKIRAALEGMTQIEKVINIESVYFGQENVLVCMKVDFVDSLSLKELEDAIDAAEIEIRKIVPSAQDIYIEADTFKKNFQKRAAAMQQPEPH